MLLTARERVVSGSMMPLCLQETVSPPFSNEKIHSLLQLISKAVAGVCVCVCVWMHVDLLCPWLIGGKEN